MVGLKQLASALATVHEHNLVHHDVQKANILLSPAKDAWCLIDFGNAAFRTKENGRPNMQRNSLCARGSEFPELAKALLTGNGNYQPDFPIDIWAFGQLILELLKARLPEAHTAVLQDQAYLDGLQSSDNPRQVPGLRAHLEYLATLEESHNYAQQVVISMDPTGWSEDDRDALNWLKFVAENCLAINSASRPYACQLQACLFDFMVKKRWSGSLAYV